MANITAPGNLRLRQTWRVSARFKPAAASNGKTRGVNSRFIVSEFIIGQWPGRLERVQDDCWVLIATRIESHRLLLREHAARVRETFDPPSRASWYGKCIRPSARTSMGRTARPSLQNPRGSQAERAEPRGLDAEIIIANAPDPVFVADLEGKILQANDAVSELLGFRPDELLEQSLSRFISPA